MLAVRRLALAALAPLVLAAAPAEAQPYPIMDQVILTLSAEDWVETETARVTVAIDAALAGADAGNVRAEMLSGLEALAPDAEWRFVGFDRVQDESGLERWSARAEARLPETALGGLADRAEEASRAGLQLALESTDFSPTVAEVEAVKAQLRSRIYQQAGEELARLTSVYPDRGYRVANIDFVNMPVMPYMEAQDMMMARAEAMPAPMEKAAGLAVAQKVTVNAQIVLQTITEWTGGEDGGE